MNLLFAPSISPPNWIDRTYEYCYDYDYAHSMSYVLLSVGLSVAMRVQ